MEESPPSKTQATPTPRDENAPAGVSSHIPGDYVAGDKRISQTAGGDIVGRDKIINNIQNIVQRALTAAEEAGQARALETQTLAQGVRAMAERLQVRAGESVNNRKPFKGLAEYRLNDAEIFWGRSRAVQEVIQNLASGPLTVLHSEAGLGKTSLLQAGLSPQLLAAEHLPLYLRPYNVDPGQAVKRAFIADLSQTPLLAAAPLREFLLQVSAILGSETTLYIYLDQFEEFFNQLDDPTRAAFVPGLAECLDDAGLNVRWVLAPRTESFGQLANFRPAIRNPFENDVQLVPLTRADAFEVMARTAEHGGLAFESGLVERLLDDLGKAKIAPAQLQLVCSALYEALEPSATTITSALYEHAGQVAGILRNYLDNVLAHNMPPADRDPAWQVLAEVAEAGAMSATETGLIAYLQTYAAGEKQTRRVLEFLETSQLLRRTDERYELASDSLLPRIRQWAAEQAVLEQARAEGIRQLRHIRASALRGLAGGALGFSLAYLATYTRQFDRTLVYLFIERSVPGAIAGLLLVLFADVAFASYHGRRRWRRWVWGGLAGAVTFSFALMFNGVLHSRDLPAFPPIAIEGGVWGLVTGLGLIWALNNKGFWWQIVSVAVIASSLILAVLEGYGHGFGLPPRLEMPPLWRLLAAGAVMPLCVLLAGLWSLPRGDE